MSKHSPNCTCDHCTGGDAYSKRLRSNYGKNASWKMYGGVTADRANFNDYDSNHAVGEPVVTGVIQGGGATTNKANLKTMLGDALGNFVGDLIQAKKSGQILPPVLDKAAGIGINIENSAKKAALEQAQMQTGKQVLQFSPVIIGVFAGLVLLVLFMFIRK